MKHNIITGKTQYICVFHNSKVTCFIEIGIFEWFLNLKKLGIFQLREGSNGKLRGGTIKTRAFKASDL